MQGKTVSSAPRDASSLPELLKEFGTLTLSAFLLDAGIYFFKFPNNFSFGGVSGISIILNRLLPWSASSYNLTINMLLLLVGFLFIGRDFAAKTVYVSVVSSLTLSLLEKLCPMSAPLTGQPMLELIFAIVLPAVSAAILFNRGASSGGTDIVAMVLKKHTSLDIGKALFCVDLVIAIGACFVFDVQTGLFSFTGLMAKTLVIDGVIENINLCKYFTIICEDPEPICDFIHKKLNRSATVFSAEGTYSHTPRKVILTVMKRSQAVQLRNFIRSTEPHAFMMITNSSEIIGKGFRGLN
ncbi:MAG: YitT family protein [Clostridia bacterium]|nr:YitT family protein [Clostridia bacterium]